jgi:hypothetical protein
MAAQVTRKGPAPGGILDKQVGSLNNALKKKRITERLGRSETPP